MRVRRQRAGAGRRAPLVLAALLVLAACAERGGSGAAGVVPVAAPVAVQPRIPPPSDPLVDRYAAIEEGLTATGRLRSETAPEDAPYSVADLVRNFERVAFFDEYVDIGGRFVQAETPALLRRWDRPIRVEVVTGASLDEAAVTRDRRNVAAFTRRLAGLTGLDMAMAEGEEANYLVLILSTAEQMRFVREAADEHRLFATAAVDALGDVPEDIYCTAYFYPDPDDPSLYGAVAMLIRAEHPPLTRLSCIHEEMAQAMGLPNDSPDARPSLFNDSLEFAFLTQHDEILLRMLYDKRLRPGMSAAEARPLLPDIARDAVAAQPRQAGPRQAS